jgi:hypothetical protein
MKATLVVLAALAGLILILLSGLGALLIISQILDHSDWEGTNVWYLPVLLLIAGGGVALMRPAFRQITRSAR